MFTPFSGWLFDAAQVGDPGLATSPPYDVITKGDRRDLLARSPYNIVRLLLPGDDGTDASAAAGLIEAWVARAALVRDPSARFYLYDTAYTGPDGSRKRSLGVIGALDLRELGDGVVPHEATIPSHREDRLAVLRTTQANLDPIIALSAAPELPGLLAAPDTEPRVDFVAADGSRHRLHDVTDPEVVAAVRDAVSSHPVSIADGHHRYTTGLRYRAERNEQDGAGQWNCIMAVVAPAEGSGLAIGPYHRVLPATLPDLHQARHDFDIQPARPVAPDAPGELVVAAGGEAHRLVPRGPRYQALAAPHRDSSTAVAAALLYPALGVDEEGADYFPEVDAAIARAAEIGGTAVLAAPLPEHALALAGEEGLQFPTKSTFFNPKPRAGLVMRWFGGADDA